MTPLDWLPICCTVCACLFRPADTIIRIVASTIKNLQDLCAGILVTSASSAARTIQMAGLYRPSTRSRIQITSRYVRL